MLVLAAIALLSIGVWQVRRTSLEPRRSAEQVSWERLRSELILTNGHLILAGTSNYFTGIMLERFADGSRKSRTTVTNGLLHGISEGWYTNGQLQVSEHFREGVSHGQRVKWHANGRKASEAEIVEGQLQGRFVSWYDTGILSTEVELKQGRPEGRSRAYYPSGALKSEVTMRNGELVSHKNWREGELAQTQPAVMPTP